jgi:hypothetical protein
MARLCRMHFAGMGEACARFHPLTLDFRQPATGAAQDSVLWLRNGGGKTTLISLFYSTVVPNQNYFLGKLLKKGTSVGDFLRLNELGVIVSEWDFPALGAPRRIIGQVLLLKEHELKRRFFSFAVAPGFGLEQLPVLGLGKPVRSIDALLDELREAEQRHPAMDLVIPEDQTDWEQHLERIGLDPFLFQMHLKMNMQEGGASDLFKLKAPEDFLRLFLELVFDERATEELEKSLTELREKIARAPDRQAAIEFGEELLKSLRPFATEAAERERLRGEQEGLCREMAAVASAIREFLRALDADEASRSEELAKWTEMLGDLKTKRDQHQRYARGYERLGREYLIEETKLAWELARDAEVAAKRRAQLLAAAIAHRVWSRKQAELSACVKQLESLLREHRPEWERVRTLGAQVQAAWTRQVAALLAAQIDATAQRKTAMDELRILQNARTELTGEHAKATANREAADAALTKHDTARGRLVDREVIEARESGSRARERWAAKATDAEAAATKLRSEAAELKDALASAIVARNEAAQQINESERELAQTRQTIEQCESMRARVSALPAVRELCEGAEADLRNPHLAPNLDAVADVADAKLIELGMADADDERSLRQLNRDGLLAQALDLEAVLRRVHEAGARSALPLYRWLAEHRSAAEALDLLRREPAAYSGILVQNAADLEKARAAVESLNIKTPILLVTLEALPPAKAGAQIGTHTVLPSEHGLFSTKEAARARPRIEERRGTRETERESQGMRAQHARDAASRVREFATTWPQTRIDELERAVAAGLEALSALNTSLATLTTLVEGLEAQQGENQRAQLLRARSLEAAKSFVRELDTFVADHENHAERWRDLRDLSLTQLDAIGEKLTRLAGQEPQLDEQAENANHRWLALSGDLSAARTRLAELPQEYLGEAAESPDDRPAAELEPEFRAAIASYEGKVQKGEIEGRITELRGAASELHREFEKQKGSIDEAEIIRESRRPALDADASQQKETVIATCAATMREKENYDAALKQKPEPREFKAGTDTHPEILRPATSAECTALAAKMQTVASTAAEELQQAQQHTEQIERAIERIKSRRPSYRTQLDRLGKSGEATVAAHAEFSDDDEANFALVKRVCQRAEETQGAHEKVEKSMRRRFDTAMHPLITGEHFSKRAIPFRERLQRLTFEDFATQAQRHVRGVEDQVKGSQEELDTQEQEKRILVQKLDVVARQAANLFDQAARVSEMPESMGPWARQPFLRITLPRKNDPTERHVLLGQAVDRWFQPAQNIPRGAELAFQCLLALCGTKTANVRILKPEYNLRAASHDIMALVQEFSDGEKLTTAIVLYCILVRLRARQKARAEHVWESDAGLLLLDNPFGKATLATFVDLQLRMARQMGVQLVYATGVGDFGALKAFPHYVRLRNSSRGKATGDYHVTNDSRVEGVTLGFQQDGNLETS